MRTARIRVDQWESAYYHCMGRVAGEPGHQPFGDVEKERLFFLLERLTVFHTVEVISFVVRATTGISYARPPRDFPPSTRSGGAGGSFTVPTQWSPRGKPRACTSMWLDACAT